MIRTEKIGAMIVELIEGHMARCDEGGNDTIIGVGGSKMDDGEYLVRLALKDGTVFSVMIEKEA